MKKHFIFGAIAAALLSFCACDTEEIINDVIDEGIFGSATFTITLNNSSETLEFSSAVTDSYMKDSIDESFATIALCSQVDLRESELKFPYAAFQFGDTIAGTKNCHTILTGNLLQDFCYDSIKSLLRSPDGANLLVLSKVLENNDTAWFISDAGSIEITSYPRMGHNLEGSVTNMPMLYFTTAQVEANKDAINNEIEQGTFDIHNWTTPCTVSGSFRCRRAALVNDIINQLNEEE